MTFAIDTATPQRYLNFAAPIAEGYVDCYVKMGGDNVDTYEAPYYRVQVDKARAAGYEHIGHYWVPDANPNDPDSVDTPTQQADYMCDRLHDFRRATDFIVLDNESLDGAVRFSDVQAAEFIWRVRTRLHILGHQVLTYSGWYDAAGIQWPAVLEAGSNFIIADYRASSQPPFGFPDVPTIPRDRIVGHQFGGRPFAAVPGSPVQQVVTDVNAFADHAFNFGDEMGYLEVRPARGNINTPFGPRPKPTPTSPAIHYGQDYGWGGGDAIFAARGGLVRDYAYVGSYGNRLVIDHGNGRQTWYCHLSSNVVPVGTVVNAGQQVAWMGATGNVTAKHLHFELRIDGVATDPEPYFVGAGTAGGGTTPIEEDDFMTDMNEFLNTKAFDNGPSISELFRDMSVVYHAMFNGGPSMEDNGNPIQRSLAQINRAVSEPSAVVGITDAQVDALAAKVAAAVEVPAGGTVDAVALAKAVRAEFKANPLS